MEIVAVAVPTPFSVGPVNAYLVRDDPLTLVDCGPRTAEAWDALRRGIGGAGVPLRRVERLVLTHPHHDHAGLAARVREESGCAVYAHPVDHPRLRGEPGAWRRIAGFLVEACARAGVPGPERDEMARALAGLERFAERLDVVWPAREGDDLAFASGRLQVVHTPGHARGALCLWEPGRRVLLSGDSLIPHISSNALLEPGRGAFREPTLPRYLETLARLSALGARRVLPGHGTPMGEPAGLIARRLAFHEARAREICDLVGNGATTPWEIGRRLFPGAPPGQGLLVVSEVVGHLDLLASRGRVRFQGQEGPWVAEPVDDPVRGGPAG